MAKQFIKIYLNKKAEGYISQKLNIFGNIGVKISNLISTSKHEIWGFFSNEISDKDLIQFEYGGIFADRPINEVIEVVNETLKRHTDSCWILIDNNGNVKSSPEDNAIENVTTAFFYDNIVLHFLSKHPSSCDDIEKTFRFGGAYPFIGFTSHLNDGIKNTIINNTVNDSSIDLIIKNIDLLIIGAYDEEGYLIVELDK
jgi:hypothetical protein